MRLRDFTLFSDENIPPEVVLLLRAKGFDVLDVVENSWNGDSDETQMARAHTQGRVILTHDTDMSQLAWSGLEPCIGIITLRPGDLPAAESIVALESLFSIDPELTVPFLLIVKSSDEGQTLIRIRQLAP